MSFINLWESRRPSATMMSRVQSFGCLKTGGIPSEAECSYQVYIRKWPDIVEGRAIYRLTWSLFDASPTPTWADLRLSYFTYLPTWFWRYAYGFQLTAPEWVEAAASVLRSRRRLHTGPAHWQWEALSRFLGMNCSFYNYFEVSRFGTF